MSKIRVIPRGIRNNNPLNIRIGNVWFGEVPHPTDESYEQFCQMEYGIRAAFVIIRRYIRRYGHNTIRSIVSTWDGTSGEDAENYISKVSKKINIDPDEPILYEDKDIMCKLVAAMAESKCGCAIEPKKISLGYDLA